MWALRMLTSVISFLLQKDVDEFLEVGLSHKSCDVGRHLPRRVVNDVMRDGPHAKGGGNVVSSVKYRKINL